MKTNERKASRRPERKAMTIREWLARYDTEWLQRHGTGAPLQGLGMLNRILEKRNEKSR